MIIAKITAAKNNFPGIFIYLILLLFEVEINKMKEIAGEQTRTLPDRLMVGHQILDLGIGVRIPVRQQGTILRLASPEAKAGHEFSVNIFRIKQ